MDEQQKLTFPDGFMWGTATAAFQIEGGADERGRTIWDRFCETDGKVLNGDTGKIACDHYHRFQSDVINMIKPLGTKYYRFSISWARVLTFHMSTTSELTCSTNRQGVQFYNQLISVLIDHDIVPVATLYHWDLPLEIQDDSGGWATPAHSAGASRLTHQFAIYARTCFQLFGDRVKWWITLNEPWCSAVLSYETGEHAPGTTNNLGVDVYNAGHNLLLAHNAAAVIYKKEFQMKQKGKIGITLNSMWFEPENVDDKNCLTASRRALDFELGWFAHPIYFGDYPDVMRNTIGKRLPKFTEQEQLELRESSDFFGLNHYSTSLIGGLFDDNALKNMGEGYFRDRGVIEKDKSEWTKTDMGWNIVPNGLTQLLEHIHITYGSPKGGIIITENGLAARENNLNDALKSCERVDFYQSYIQAVHHAINGDKKVDVKGYFLWSLMDNFEWAFGFSKRFGLYYVDYETLKRTAKPAVSWYASVIKSNSVSI